MATASQLLSGVRPAGPVEAARKQLARDLVTEIREADQRIKTLTAQIGDTVAATGSRLTEVQGVKPVIAGRLLGRTRGGAGSRPRRRSPVTPALRPSRSPAPTEPGTASRAVETGNSIRPCTSSR